MLLLHHALLPRRTDGAADLVLVEWASFSLVTRAHLGDWRSWRGLHPQSSRRQRGAFLFSYRSKNLASPYEKIQISAQSHSSVFTNPADAFLIVRMDLENPIFWIVAGLIALLAITIVVPRFSSEARLGRRRRKNNARVVSKSRGPSVKFSVHTKDEKK